MIFALSSLGSALLGALSLAVALVMWSEWKCRRSGSRALGMHADEAADVEDQRKRSGGSVVGRRA